MPRPTKLTTELATKILDALRAGIGRDSAVDCAGIGRSTFYSWLERGKNCRRGKFLDFLDAVKRAEADAHIRNVVAVQKVAMGGEVISRLTIHRPDGTTIERLRFSVPDFRAAAWWLERKYPEHWGRKTAVDLSERPDRSQLIWIQDRGGRESCALRK